MQSSEDYLNINNSRRYFHLVAFTANPDFPGESILKDFGLSDKGKDFESIKEEGFSIYKNTITSEERYYFGFQDENNENQFPPYKYDIVGLYIKKINSIIIGYPFKKLATSYTIKAHNSGKLLKKGSYAIPNLEKFVKLNEKKVYSNDLFSTQFSGLDLSLFSDKNIGSINLGGAKPMDSDLYRDVFSTLIGTEGCTMKKCTLKCSIAINEIGLPTVRAHVHLDKYGNIKMYLNDSLRGLFTLPLLFQLLKIEKCLGSTLVNPILRSDE